ncbi:Lysine-specific histone demethylase 1B [Goodea atripinnis]|uniref:Lysine-specific histone demethylase 1B n=1 Tax=Goodea atripinnis TaxID=208336 RepID=A0ABV0Q2S0_9TELE
MLVISTEKVQEIKKDFLQESGMQFSELEEKVLQFHLSNLEFACGSTLDQVSARFWDHNEFFAQFSGDHTLLTNGYSVLLHKLAEGLDILTDCPVLVTVPLTLLQKNIIRFHPPLPERKLKAIHSLGAGIIEKVFYRRPVCSQNHCLSEGALGWGFYDGAETCQGDSSLKVQQFMFFSELVHITMLLVLLQICSVFGTSR